MRSSIARVLAIGAAIVVTAVPSVLAAGHGHKGTMGAKTTKAATVTCPVCHMAMASTKSKGAPVRVLVNHHYYYCCAGCGFAKTANAKKPAMAGKHMGHRGMGHMSMGHMGKM
jgi:hypothetical protein